MNVVPLTGTPLSSLVELLPPGAILTGDEDLARYSRDWSGDHVGRPLAVARPSSVEEMSTLMRFCFQHNLPVVPQGGLTGLVGAAVAEEGKEIVISLERMNRVRSISPLDFAMVVEAGCILEEAKRAAEEVDCLLPIAFGAQGSCRIGGNIATNAGGFNVLRYGMTRDLLLGLEVVLADGRVWNGLKVLRKDNRGYDLKQLFIGSEGTLGIITAAAFKLFPRPTQVETALVGLRSVEDAMELYALARRECSDLLSAFELILRGGIEIALAARPDLSDPLADACPVYVLIETSASGRIDLRAMMEDFLASCGGLAQGGVMAQSRAQAERLWLYREVMVEEQGRGEPYLRTDVSVPISRIADFVADVLAALAARHPDAVAVTYGHVGDGNLHINIIPPERLDAQAVRGLFHDAEAVIFEVLDRYGGSISAEHGIGRVKQAFLERIDPVDLDLSRRLKDVLDPGHILARDAFLPRGARKAENEDRQAMTLKLDKVNRGPHLSTLVASSISREIAQGRLKPGDQLPTEQALATTFGVSRNVVREAIARLRSEGRVWSQQGRGAFVSAAPNSTVLTIDHETMQQAALVRSLFELRGILEVEAAALAARRRRKSDIKAMRDALAAMATSPYGSVAWLGNDLEFHRVVAEATGNPYIGQFLAFVSERVRDSILAAGHRQKSDEMARITLGEHERILVAIEAGDADAAQAAMRAHLAGAAGRVGLGEPHARKENSGDKPARAKAKPRVRSIAV